MRNLMRVLTICLAAVMLVAAFAFTASAAQTKFTDVSEKDETLTKAVSLLEGLGITKGTTDTTFGTNDNVTREQMAAFIYRLMMAGKSLEGGENSTTFEDIYDDTYFGMISWANAMGIIKGVSATEFDPDGTITLQDAYTMLVRALGYEDAEVLAYPHDHINIAESKEVDLGNGLPSKVSYTSKLTRGNVAILLYNAFYAEMAKVEVVERERLLGADSTLGTPKYVLEAVEEHPRLCEEVYEVIEEDFTVVETTHYAFNKSKDSNEYKPTQDDAGKGTMFLTGLENNQTVQNFYTTVGELGLGGKADDYIMSEVTVFYTYDKKEEAISDILYAEAKMDTASATEIAFTRVSADRTIKHDLGAFYTNSRSSGYDVRLDGKATAAGKTLYFFDAPYTFVQPSYAGLSTEEQRYAARNADNTKLIDLVCLDVDKELYSYYLTDDVFAPADGFDEETGTFTALNGALAIKFEQAIMKGYIKADIYDPDGDGRYEYMWYKPASFGKIVMEGDELMDTDGVVNETAKVSSSYELDTVPTIYAKGAKLYGTAFNDEDFVVAYVNKDANMIDIFGVAQGKRGTATAYDKSNGYVTIGNQKLRYIGAAKAVKDYFAGDNPAGGKPWNYDVWCWTFRDKLLGIPAVLDTKLTAYVYDNILFYYELEELNSTYSGENILIPVSRYTESARNKTTYELEQYLEVIIDGEVKHVLVDVENCFPAPEKTNSGTYNFGITKTAENNHKYDVYYGKICTYTVDKNGVYSIKSILHGEDEDGDEDHIDLVYDSEDFHSENKVNQAGNDLQGEGSVYLMKDTSQRYELLDGTGSNANTMIGTFGTSKIGSDKWYESGAYIDSATFMFRVIDSEGKKDDKIVTYFGRDLPGTIESPLMNVQYIYQNRGESTTSVDLVLLYAEVMDSVEFETAISDTEYVIVKGSNIVKVAEEEYSYSYEVFDPATGTVLEGVLGTAVETTAKNLDSKVNPFAIGSVVNVTTGGKLDDEEDDRSEIVALFDNNPVDERIAYLYEVSAEDMSAEVIPVRSVVDDEYFKWGETRSNPFDIYEIAEDVKISVLTFEERENLETATIKSITLEELAEAGDELKSYTDSYVAPEDANDPDVEYSTEYCKYVKAYITATYKSKYEVPIIDSIIVVVHPEQTAELDVE